MLTGDIIAAVGDLLAEDRPYEETVHAVERALSAACGSPVRIVLDAPADALPLRIGTRLVGSLAVENDRARAALAAHCEALFPTLAVWIDLRRRLAVATRLGDEAYRDALTGLANRRAFVERLAEERGRGRRAGEPLALVMLDVDHFKLYNDRYGHLAGDAALRAVAQALAAQVRRPTDLVARWGGEEFVLLLPGTDAAGARARAAAARDAVAALQLPHAASTLGYVTVSAGWATDPGTGDDDAFVELADAALYAAKSAGRNRVAGADEVDGAERAAAIAHLPHAGTPLIGREGLVVQVARSLTRERVTVLLGPGGIGKTRVAIAAVERAATLFPSGVRFVSLSGVAADGVHAAIAAALDVRNGITGIAHALAGEHALLVLDACEDVVDGVVVVIEELERLAPRAHVLITTRIALPLEGTPTLRVPPLDVPDGPDDAAASDAGRLFAARAFAAAPRLGSAVAQPAILARIARCLHGHPLAIEVAAARCAAIDPETLADALEHETDATVDRVIGWAYDESDAPARQLFARLAAFAGSFTYDAAVEVAEPGLPVASALAALVDHALVVPQENVEPARFRLLDIVRAFAKTRVPQAEQVAAGAAHAARTAAIVERCDPERGALFADARRGWRDVRDEIEVALERTREADPLTHARIASSYALAWQEAGAFSVAVAHLDDALASAECDARLRARVLLARSRTIFLSGHHRSALADAERAIACAQENGDALEVDRARSLRLLITTNLGLREGAAEELEAIAERFERGGALWSAAEAWTRLGGVLIFNGALDAARPVQERALALRRQIGYEAGIAVTLAALGVIAFLDGDLGEALARTREAAAIADAAGNASRAAQCRVNVASYATTAGDLVSARVNLRRVIPTLMRTRELRPLASALETAATVAMRLERYGEAAKLIGAADACYDQIGSPRAPVNEMSHQECLTACCSALGEECELLRAEGRSMPLAAAAALVEGL